MKNRKRNWPIRLFTVTTLSLLVLSSAAPAARAYMNTIEHAPPTTQVESSSTDESENDTSSEADNTATISEDSHDSEGKNESEVANEKSNPLTTVEQNNDSPVYVPTPFTQAPDITPPANASIREFDMGKVSWYRPLFFLIDSAILPNGNHLWANTLNSVWSRVAINLDQIESNNPSWTTVEPSKYTWRIINLDTNEIVSFNYQFNGAFVNSAGVNQLELLTNASMQKFDIGRYIFSGTPGNSSNQLPTVSSSYIRITFEVVGRPFWNVGGNYGWKTDTSHNSFSDTDGNVATINTVFNGTSHPNASDVPTVAISGITNDSNLSMSLQPTPEDFVYVDSNGLPSSSPGSTLTLSEDYKERLLAAFPDFDLSFLRLQGTILPRQVTIADLADFNFASGNVSKSFDGTTALDNGTITSQPSVTWDASDMGEVLGNASLNFSQSDLAYLSLASAGVSNNIPVSLSNPDGVLALVDQLEKLVQDKYSMPSFSFDPIRQGINNPSSLSVADQQTLTSFITRLQETLFTGQVQPLQVNFSDLANFTFTPGRISKEFDGTDSLDNAVIGLQPVVSWQNDDMGTVLDNISLNFSQSDLDYLSLASSDIGNTISVSLSNPDGVLALLDKLEQLIRDKYNIPDFSLDNIRQGVEDPSSLDSSDQVYLEDFINSLQSTLFTGQVVQRHIGLEDLVNFVFTTGDISKEFNGSASVASSSTEINIAPTVIWNDPDTEGQVLNGDTIQFTADELSYFTFDNANAGTGKAITIQDPEGVLMLLDKLEAMINAHELVDDFSMDAIRAAVQDPNRSDELVDFISKLNELFIGSITARIVGLDDLEAFDFNSGLISREFDGTKNATNSEIELQPTVTWYDSDTLGMDQPVLAAGTELDFDNSFLDFLTYSDENATGNETAITVSQPDGIIALLEKLDQAIEVQEGNANFTMSEIIDKVQNYDNLSDNEKALIDAFVAKVNGTNSSKSDDDQDNRLFNGLISPRQVSIADLAAFTFNPGIISKEYDGLASSSPSNTSFVANPTVNWNDDNTIGQVLNEEELDFSPEFLAFLTFASQEANDDGDAHAVTVSVPDGALAVLERLNTLFKSELNHQNYSLDQVIEEVETELGVTRMNSFSRLGKFSNLSLTSLFNDNSVNLPLLRADDALATFFNNLSNLFRGRITTPLVTSPPTNGNGNGTDNGDNNNNVPTELSYEPNVRTENLNMPMLNDSKTTLSIAGLGLLLASLILYTRKRKSK